MWRLLILMLCCFSVNGQRNLTTVLDPAQPQQQNVLFNTRVLIGGHADSFLLAYNDITFARYNYPIVSGARLKFDTYKNPLTLYKAAVYFCLRATPGMYATGYLYRFSGTGFTRITITGVMITNCIVYGDDLYFLTTSAGTTRLYRYNGTAVSEVGVMPSSSGYELHVAEGFLYINGYAYAAGTVNFIRRFNGTSFFTLPYSGP